jgi:predicted histidine transporter YuiF (NhaC family)
VYEDFCSFDKTSQILETKVACEQSSGIWNPGQKGYDPIAEPIGYCDLTSKCSNAYQEASKAYEQKVFIALVVIGVVVLVLSFFMSTNIVLGSALALTAVLDFVIASIRYWQYSDKLLKVGILFVALATLIYLAVKKFTEKI